jgi:hypothetical protein
MTCRGHAMQELATAERSGDGWFQRVTLSRCDTCGRIDSHGESSDPWWVTAKAVLFLNLREEALEQAGLECESAVAVFDSANRNVIFWLTVCRASPL